VKTPAERFDLSGRAALITGGSRGLGRAMALGFAHAGADVVISSRKQAACDALTKEIEETTGRRALAHACHVGHWDELEGLVDACWERFGRLDVLVNNAGMSPLYDDLVEVSETYWDKVIGVNLKGPFRLSALVGSRMAAGEGGSIINISSAGSLGPRPTEIPYGAAKAGLNAITTGFAAAFAPKVRVNCIIPGAFETDIAASSNWFETAAETGIRVGQPDEIVGAALYFASDASSFTTGALLRVTGHA
jgi:NAD(P)-dependent dehydrogenase (short-subunit alcohol dehydrogenase family)